ncbi:hypothetical protein EJ04DRAFT_436020 [Polyplosphaeria fusca]|uniref:Uncharacterized protein n=1 Tax=Polyplosphaeria fusca TaxID=682080 RepID=A0A9P4QYV1_9PLEO|nr:hypothetical protein EJ04DRAFT_436020 [Polyplosphaeria fusca]
MSELESKYVKTGLWVDLDKGPILGKTITTDTKTGAVVVALLAIFSSLAMSHLWSILSFTTHQIRADGKPAGALLRQQQVVIRTLPTPGALFMESFKLFWSWRPESKTQRALARTSMFMGMALIFVALTWTTSIFASFVIDTTNIRVLVSSPLCGPISLDFDSWGNISYGYLPKVIALAEPYAEDCHMAPVNARPARCSALIGPKTLFRKEEAICPFDSSMCLEGTPIFTLDSGLIDLNEFGLNLNNRDRVKYRKRTTCAILPLENHTETINASDFTEYSRPTLPQEKFMLFNYGHVEWRQNWTEGTFIASLLASNVTHGFAVSGSITAGTPEWAAFSNHQPLPEMSRTDADTTLILFQKNMVWYLTPVEDPVFGAHRVFNSLSTATGGGQRRDVYLSDTVGTAVGCTEQLSGVPPMPTKENMPQANGIQLSILQHSVKTNALVGLTLTNKLNLTNSFSGSFIASVPDNQWQLEIERWETIAWTGYQILLTDYSTGIKNRDPDADLYTNKPATTGEKQFCNVQKMQKQGGFVNINVFGLAFIITIACVVIAIDMTLFKFLIYLSQFRRHVWLSPRLDRWLQDGVLQLQRRAYEAEGQGHWTNAEEAVPLTGEHVKLRDLATESVSRRHACPDCERKYGAVTEVMTPTSIAGSDDLKKDPKVEIKVSQTMRSDDTIVAQPRHR